MAGNALAAASGNLLETFSRKFAAARSHHSNEIIFSKRPAGGILCNFHFQGARYSAYRTRRNKKLIPRAEGVMRGRAKGPLEGVPPPPPPQEAKVSCESVFWKMISNRGHRLEAVLNFNETFFVAN